MQLKRQMVEDNEVKEELKDQILSREQALSIFEQLLKLGKEITGEQKLDSGEAA